MSDKKDDMLLPDCPYLGQPNPGESKEAFLERYKSQCELERDMALIRREVFGPIME